MITTIQLEKTIKRKLTEMKSHPRETYNDVIERLLKGWIDSETQSSHTLRNIELAIEDIKKGKTYTTTQAKKRLGIR